MKHWAFGMAIALTITYVTGRGSVFTEKVREPFGGAEGVAMVAAWALVCARKKLQSSKEPA